MKKQHSVTLRLLLYYPEEVKMQGHHAAFSMQYPQKLIIVQK